MKQQKLKCENAASQETLSNLPLFLLHLNAIFPVSKVINALSYKKSYIFSHGLSNSNVLLQ